MKYHESFDLDNFKPQPIFLFLGVWFLIWAIIIVDYLMYNLIIAGAVISFCYSFTFGKYEVNTNV